MHVGHVPISALIMWLYIILLLSSERRLAWSPLPYHHRALGSASPLGDADWAGSRKGGQTMRWSGSANETEVAEKTPAEVAWSSLIELHSHSGRLVPQSSGFSVARPHGMCGSWPQPITCLHLTLSTASSSLTPTVSMSFLPPVPLSASSNLSMYLLSK